MQSSHTQKQRCRRARLYIGTRRALFVAFASHDVIQISLRANSFQILLSLSQLFIARSRADNGTEATSLSAHSQPVRYDWITYSLLAATSFAISPVTSRFCYVRSCMYAEIRCHTKVWESKSNFPFKQSGRKPTRWWALTLKHVIIFLSHLTIPPMLT